MLPLRAFSASTNTIVCVKRGGKPSLLAPACPESRRASELALWTWRFGVRVQQQPNSRQPTSLIRTIGRWSLTALVVNSVIGGGIFGLPAVVSGRAGRLAPTAYGIAGAGMAIVAGCLNEIASQFQDAGGPYLYARETLGRFWGIQIAWMTWLSRIAAGSGTANLFTTYLGQILPRAPQPAYRFAILTILVGVLAVANYVGVKSGARVSDFFTATKVLLLAIFIGAGLWW